MARELGREGFGAFMFALSLTGALVLCAGFGTDELTAREVARDRSRAGRYLADVISLKLVTCTVLLVGAALVVSLGSFSDDTLPAVVLVGAGVAIEAISRTWYSVFQAHERLDLVSLSVIVQRTTTALVGVVLLKLGAGVVIAATVFAVGALLGLGMALLSARRLRLAVRPRGPAALARAPALRATDRRRQPAVRAAAPARRDAAVVPFGRSRGRRLLSGVQARREHAVPGVGDLGGDAAVAGTRTAARVDGGRARARRTSSASRP